jgi:hypothetical protein
MSERPMKRERTFLVSYALVLLMTLAVVISFNWLVDPMQIGTGPAWPRFNETKYRSHTTIRQNKAIRLKRLKPHAVVLGNSRADIGIDPRHPALLAHGKSYNLAIPASDMVEKLRYYQGAVQAQPGLKTVVLGIDLVSFAPSKALRALDAEVDAYLTPGSSLGPSLEVAASYRTLVASMVTVAGNLFNLPVRENYLATGRLDRRNPPGMSLEDAFGLHLKQVYLGPGSWYAGYELAPEQMTAFRELVRDCAQRGIDLKVLISPAHALQWEAIHIAGQWAAWESWKREVAAVTPVWDFSGYNSVTTEALTPDMQNYIESSHYLPRVGRWMLDRIFDQPSPDLPADFGVLLKPDMLDEHLLRLREQRQRWINASPEEQALMQRWQSEVSPESPG